MATIITTHITTKDEAVPNQVCPGIGIQAIDIVQPPGIAIGPMADIDVQNATVKTTLIAKSSAKTPKNTCSEARSNDMGVNFRKLA